MVKIRYHYVYLNCQRYHNNFKYLAIQKYINQKSHFVESYVVAFISWVFLNLSTRYIYFKYSWHIIWYIMDLQQELELQVMGKMVFVTNRNCTNHRPIELHGNSTNSTIRQISICFPLNVTKWIQSEANNGQHEIHIELKWIACKNQR